MVRATIRSYGSSPGTTCPVCTMSGSDVEDASASPTSAKRPATAVRTTAADLVHHPVALGSRSPVFMSRIGFPQESTGNSVPHDLVSVVSAQGANTVRVEGTLTRWMKQDHVAKLDVSILFLSIRAFVSWPQPLASMCTPVSIPRTFSCQAGSGTGVGPVTTHRTPSTGSKCSPDFARSSARPRGFAESRASLLGARASSPRQARESGATSTVRGHRCPRSQEDRDPGKPTGPG